MMPSKLPCAGMAGYGGCYSFTVLTGPEDGLEGLCRYRIFPVHT